MPDILFAEEFTHVSPKVGFVGRREMADAYEVAKYLLQLAACEDEPEPLTHLRLQKLLYYTQGWSLGLFGTTLFRERIEAWAHGPVVRDVYPRFANFGNQPIPPEGIAAAAGLSEDEQEIIGSVWEAYKGFSATSLRDKTHDEPPWKDARKGFSPAEKCENEITPESMHKFFSALAGKN